MITLQGFNKKEQFQSEYSKIHHYDLLPKEGLGRTFDKVGLNQIVIIPIKSVADSITWHYSKPRIISRAKELNASINYIEVDTLSFLETPSVKLWFSPKNALINESKEISIENEVSIHNKEIDDLKKQVEHLKKALDTIHKAFWSEGETEKEKIGDLKMIAFNALYELEQNIY